MPKVESVVDIKADVDKVFNLAKNVEDFPNYMEDLKSVTILEENEDKSRLVTEFVGVVKEFKTTMQWVEEDIWDAEAKTCTFTLVKGDFKSYSGKWTFEPIDGGTRYSSVIEFDYDIPMIGPLIKNLITKKVKQNVDNMLNAIKRKAESTD